MPDAARNGSTPRRCTRVRLELSLILTSVIQGHSLSQPCHTLVVNPQGCGLQFPRSLEVGTQVRLEGLPGAASVSARVANCFPIGTDGKFWLIGVALDEPGNVWGIAEPPSDWDTTKAAVAAASAQEPEKNSREWPYSQFSRRGEFHPGRR